MQRAPTYVFEFLKLPSHTQERIPYVGFCLSEMHAKLIKARSIQQVLESFFVAGEREWDPALASMLTAQADPTKTNVGPEPKTSTEDVSKAAIVDEFQKKLEAFKRLAGGGAADGSVPKPKKLKGAKAEKGKEEEDGDSDE